MGDDALIHVRSPVGLFARARYSLLSPVAVPRWQEYHSSDHCDWQDDSGQDGSSSSDWQFDGAHKMYYRGVQAAEGWGVRPGSVLQASKQLAWRSWQQRACRPQQQLVCRPQQQLACRPQQQLARQRAPPIPEEQPLTHNELPGFLAG
jgi:hypothetical protein